MTQPIENVPAPRRRWNGRRSPTPVIPPRPIELPAIREEELPQEPVVETIPPPEEPERFVSNQVLQRTRELAAERARRRIEALRLYEPLTKQREFHDCQAKTRLLRGSNRGGKTLPAAVEVAMAVCGMSDKFPHRDGRFFCVGKNLDHVGAVMWRKLSRAGAFKIIRDSETRLWRAFRPWEAADQARASEAKPAPPLIPPRMIKSIAWENKAKGIPAMVKLQNGWELSFYSSEGKPPRGSDIDGWWFDEEIVDGDWLPEISARVMDRGGRGLWSVTPQSATQRLYELHERAEKEEGKEYPAVVETVILLSDNPHIGEHEKQEFANSLSDDEYHVRFEGEYAIAAFKVYPEFSMHTHGIEWFQVPPNWTRYAVVDPGRQVCAVLFAAIPPIEGDKYCGDFCYLYDELYIENCSASMFADRFARKVTGQQFQSFIIDHQGGRVTDTGSGRTIEDQYSDELRHRKVRCLTTGHQFTWGASAVKDGVEAFRDWLQVRSDGHTRLRIMHGVIPKFEWEIKRYRYKRVAGIITDEPESRGPVHLMACARYLAMNRPIYKEPPARGRVVTGALKAFRDKLARRKQKNGESFVRLG